MWLPIPIRTARLRAGLLLSAVLALAPAAAGAQEDSVSVGQLAEQAAAAGEAGRLEESIQLLERLRPLDPNNPNVHWNLGLSYATTGRHPEALASWQAYRVLQPDDWHVRAKLIQAYAALGDSVRLEQERAALLELRKAGTDAALMRQAHYCREQFRVGDHRVMAFEVFEPEGDEMVFYTFYTLDEDEDILGRYSLGSYDRTTMVARATGEIQPGARLYHLDWYEANGHATFGFFTERPGYAETRRMVVAALTGEARPVSRSGRAKP